MSFISNELNTPVSSGRRKRRDKLATATRNNNNHNSNGIETDELAFDKETLCGIGGWKPEWLQPFATAQFFVLNFCILAILQGALFTYMVGIMSTLEKRFAFETKVSGFILIADNLSQMFISPVVGYLGSKYNRSRLIAFGELIVALSCIITAVPYFMYGPATHFLSKAEMSNNQTKFDLCFDKEEHSCPVETLEEEQSILRFMTVPIGILIFSSFANGLGYTAFYTIGLPYVDDNIKKKNSPIYLSSISTIRLLGPMLGFVLSSFCLKFYENPFIDPGITNYDPRWIGAWWLGFLLLGFGILLATLPMFMFPKRFRDVKEAPNSELEFTQLSDAWRAFKRLTKNKVLIFHMIGGVFRIIGYLGYYIIKPKYMELQYRQSASSASFYTGATSVVTMAVGTMAGGLFIKKWKPGAKAIAIFVTSVELFSALGILTASFLQCPTPVFSGLDLINQPETRLTTNQPPTDNCLSGCECSTKVYQPICSTDGVTNYFSPCYAGCRKYDSIKGSTKLAFQNCSCIEESLFKNPAESTLTSKVQSAVVPEWLAESGLCATDCNMFVWFIIVLSSSNMVASTARTGDTLLTLRSVDPKDKSFAMGVMGSVFAVFAFIPYPLIFGAIIDSTCLVWEKTCGRTGNCWLYDMEKFRVYFHYSAVSFILIGLAFEIGTILYAGRLKNLYDEGDNDDDVEDPPMKSALEGIEALEMNDAKLPAAPLPVIQQQLAGQRKGSLSVQ